MENNQLTEREVTSLWVAARNHREILEGVYTTMEKNGEAGLAGGKMLAREIETLASAMKKLQKMIEVERT